MREGAGPDGTPLPRSPKILYLGLFFLAYVLGCGFAQLLAVVPGTGISIWPPSGIFIATLLLTPSSTWLWWIVTGLLGELVANALWFDSPFLAAVLIYVGNAVEAVFAAWLLNLSLKRTLRFETVQEVLTFLLIGAGLAPIAGATIGSATLAGFGILSQNFVTAWPLWWIGDATGVLIFAPLVLTACQNWGSFASIPLRQWLEAGVLCIVLLGVAVLSLGSYLPFAYIVMPPLLWAAVRFELKGATLALMVLALITAVFTLAGTSQFIGDPEVQKHRQIMLHLFLAISAISALIVAAISRQHQLALQTLRENVEILRSREREFSQFVNMVPSLLWRLTPDGEPVFFSRRMVEFFGLDVGDYDGPDKVGLSAAIDAVVHPDDARRLFEALNHSFTTGERFVLDYRLRRRDGIYRWMAGRAEPLRDEEGRILQWYGLCHDIEDQVHAERALQESKQQLEQMIEAVPFNVLSFSPTGRMTYASRRYLDQAGTPSAHVKDFDALALEVVHPEDFPVMFKRAKNGFLTGEPFINRFRRICRDGVYRWIEARAQPLRDADGTIVQWYLVSIDIENEIHAQENLRLARESLARASQAASLAELSASIAHEVSQPLSAVVNYSNACQRWLTAEPPNTDRARRSVEQLIQSANSAANVVSRIRALFKQSSDGRDCTSLDGIIQEVRQLVAAEALGRRIRIDVDIENDLRLVAFDRVQVQQVIMNLVRNGMDAMTTTAGERVLSIKVWRAGAEVRSSVSDRGTGVQLPGRIFEPFFTTKDQGMGMGLSISRSIIEAHGGELWAESNEPKGAIFIFTLPAATLDSP